MKTRSGYVSNSSSSSFLIGYSDISAVERFREFEGYDSFRSSVDSTDELDSRLEELVSSMAWSELFDWVSLFVSHAMHREPGYEMDFPWSKICRGFGYDDAEFRRRRDAIMSLGRELESEFSEREIGYKSPEYERYMEAAREAMGDVFELAEGFISSVVGTGKWTLRTCEYGDEFGDYGEYMEHLFMPFVCSYPGNDLVAVRKSNH